LKTCVNRKGDIMQIAITGCSGLVGSALVEHFVNQGHTVHCIQRNKSTDGLIFDPNRIENLAGGSGVDAVIHLAGENISTGRWTGKKKKRIIRSRVQGTHEIASFFSTLPNPPKVMVFASASGYYGDRSNEKLNEKSSVGSSFLADICKQWEEAAVPAEESGIRIIYARFGMVLSPHGGALHKMLPAFQKGLGGKIGNGKQYMSWISIRDLVAAIEHLLIHEELSGVFNFVAPTPVTNEEFTKTLGRCLERHTPFPVPATVVRLLFGEMGKELLLASSRVYPERLLESGYTFRYIALKDALTHCIDGGS